MSASRSAAADPAETGESLVRREDHAATPAYDILHLAELVPIIRARLAIDPAFQDDAILLSLKSIAKRSGERERWLAAFESALGQRLAVEGRDLKASLGIVLGALPRPLS